MLVHLYGQLRYPPRAFERGIVGVPVTTFIVERDGSITGVRTVRSAHRLLDAEARRVIASMPRWSPGVQRGQPVRVQFNLPITFSVE